MSNGSATDGFVIDNEFAAVRISRDAGGNSPRLRITDLRSGKSVLLDALELETLAWARHEDLAPLLDPSASRWQDGPEDGRPDARPRKPVEVSER